MTDPKVVVPYKPFVMQEGMTLESINNAPNLSAEAKKYIAIFDADGNGTFSKREADVFNATSISTTVFGATLSTEYKNGEIKYTTIPNNIETFKYAPQGVVKVDEVLSENIVKSDKSEEKEIKGTKVYTELPVYENIKQEVVKYSKTDKIIAGIEFQEGLVKDVQVADDWDWSDGEEGPNNRQYQITLNDGSELTCRVQDENDKAKIYMENGTLVFKGVRQMYFMNNHYDENEHKEVYSNIGKYKFVGCRGFVNTNGQDGESIVTAHRVMQDGSTQKSSLSLYDGTEYEGEKLHDSYVITDNDVFYCGN